MATIDIILTKKVDGLGGESDQLTVKAGYARNYLIPEGFAIAATKANKRQLEVLKLRRDEREKGELDNAQELGKALSKLIVPIKVKTGEDGKLFGSVTAAHIVDELKAHFDANVDKKKIHIEEPIKTVGEHLVELRLHPEVHVNLKLNVESTNPPPAEPEAPAAS